MLDHVLARLRGVLYGWDEYIYSPNDYVQISLQTGRLEFHRSIRFHHTSYNMRREQDVVKPFLKISKTNYTITSGNSQRCNVMLAAIEEGDGGREASRNEFWYAQVMAVLHVVARDTSEPTSHFRRLDMLWVRWLGVEPGFRGGFQKQRLERVGYVADSDEIGAFGFVDPSDVILACHLIPAFSHGRRLQEPILANSFCQDPNGDWSFFYPSRYYLTYGSYI